MTPVSNYNVNDHEYERKDIKFIRCVQTFVQKINYIETKRRVKEEVKNTIEGLFLNFTLLRQHKQ